jgi:hypothetical protein
MRRPETGASAHADVNGVPCREKPIATITETGYEQGTEVSYCLNQRDEIVSVSDSWLGFAVANDAPELTPERVRNQPLWDFVADPTTTHLYEQMLARVRRGEVVRFNFRCDSPCLRRLLEMTIRLRPDRLVEFATRALRVEERPPVTLLARSVPRSERRLGACGWCSRIKVDEDRWVGAETVVRELRLFEQERLPQLAHGICVACLAAVRKDLERETDGTSSAH